MARVAKKRKKVKSKPKNTAKKKGKKKVSPQRTVKKKTAKKTAKKSAAKKKTAKKKAVRQATARQSTVRKGTVSKKPGKRAKKKAKALPKPGTRASKKIPPRGPLRYLADPLMAPQAQQQMIERLLQKMPDIFLPGFKETESSVIMQNLVRAEQLGTLDEMARESAVDYDWNLRDVYELWHSPRLYF